MLGHNNPPTEAEIAKQRLEGYDQFYKQLDYLNSKAIPDIVESDEIAGKLSDHLRAVKDLKSEADKIHKKEKQPFLDGGRVVDGWKTSQQSRLDEISKRAEYPMIVWNRKKAEQEAARLKAIADAERAKQLALEAEALAHDVEGIHDTAQDLIDLAVKAEAKANKIEALPVRAVSSGYFGSTSVKTETVGTVSDLGKLDLNLLKSYFLAGDIDGAVKRATKAGLRLDGVTYEEIETLKTR